MAEVGPLSEGVARSTIQQVVARGLTWLLSLVATAFLARRLGPPRFGDYSLALLLGSVVASAADLGLGSIGLRELVRRDRSDVRFLGGLLKLKLVAQLGLFVVIGPVVVLAGRNVASAPVLVIGLLVAALGLAAGTVQLPLQRDLRYDVVSAADVAGRVLQLIAVLLLLHSRLSVLVASALAVPVGALCFSLPFAVRHGATLRGTLSRTETRALVRAGLPVGLVLVLGLFHFKVDSVLVAWLRPARELGLYSADYRVVELALAVPSLFAVVLLPMLSRSTSDDLQRQAQRGFDVLVATGLPVAALLVLFPRPILEVVAGPAFTSASLALQVLGGAVFFAWVNTLFAQLAVVAGISSYVLRVSLVAVAVNVLANLLVIPHWGYVGAAWTTVGSEALGSALVAATVLRRMSLRVDWWTAGALTAVACVACAGALVLPHAVEPFVAAALLVLYCVAGHRLQFLPTRVAVQSLRRRGA